MADAQWGSDAEEVDAQSRADGRRLRCFRLSLTAVLALVGAFVVGGPTAFLSTMFSNYLIAEVGVYDPSTTWVLPHNVPPRPEGLALRWVMVHDTLHERYERHGVPWYQARNATRRAEVEAGLAALAAQPAGTRPSDALLGAMDDLSVGLDYAHEPLAGVTVQRQKVALLERLHPAGLPARQPIAGDDRWHYTTWANLGTHLVHANFGAAMGGDSAATAAVEEGLACIDRAVEINPGAHFGREQWQAVAIRYLLAGMRDPTVFTTWDLVGNRYDNQTDWSTYTGIPGLGGREVSPYLNLEKFHGGDLYGESLRSTVSRIGAEEGWAAFALGMEESVPFDEPMLGMIGMWQFGGGPNPWFAITIGNTMERVGQPYLAWEAFARALSMRERWPADSAIRDPLVAHCEARQAAIEAAVKEDHAELQRRFDAELAIGTTYQANRDAYEEMVLTDNPLEWTHASFYNPFHAEHGRPNTPFSGYDTVTLRHTSGGTRTLNYLLAAFPASMLFGAGMGALLSLAFLRSKKPKPAASPLTGPTNTIS